MKTFYDYLENKMKMSRISFGSFVFIMVVVLSFLFGEISFLGYTGGRYTGESMCPTLGEISISIIDLKDKNFEVGDIIVYNATNEEKLIQHRIIDEYYNFYQLQGDNNPIPDNGWVPKRRIIGKLAYNLDLKGCEKENSNEN